MQFGHNDQSIFFMVCSKICQNACWQPAKVSRRMLFGQMRQNWLFGQSHLFTKGNREDHSYCETWKRLGYVLGPLCCIWQEELWICAGQSLKPTKAFWSKTNSKTHKNGEGKKWTILKWPWWAQTLRSENCSVKMRHFKPETMRAVAQEEWPQLLVGKCRCLIVKLQRSLFGTDCCKIKWRVPSSLVHAIFICLMVKRLTCVKYRINNKGLLLNHCHFQVLSEMVVVLFFYVDTARWSKRTLTSEDWLWNG